ncbi:transcription antitermination factor NusB [Demequina sp. TTPB684]|uniref:transcription antitermination factor NusB n=1 Tax=unclassified Demequina TaxID=2620311 RepID=UPI001CF56775|nr:MULTISPECIES: transcription antitermination factor NusB [unclassified Demequina]MCB2411679.1 transcription antitermination factor NusB [Demequina sp. TTPB684]UPU89249.1 transcription antitermination factor NusB [Demequina sp. TMPB413]
MAARTKARKRALDILFESDQRGANVSQVLAERIALSGRETELPEYSAQIVSGVVAHWMEIQALIEEASTEWTVDRMPAVDRALLRIATWEILFNDEVSVAVAIDEAVDLARDLSTDDSPRFLNGVLGHIAREAPAIRPAATDDAEMESDHNE